MKKSEIYHLAQIAVVNSPCISPEVKVATLRVLIESEDLALFSERREEKKNAETV